MMTMTMIIRTTTTKGRMFVPNLVKMFNKGRIKNQIDINVCENSIPVEYFQLGYKILGVVYFTNPSQFSF